MANNVPRKPLASQCCFGAQNLQLSGDVFIPAKVSAGGFCSPIALSSEAGSISRKCSGCCLKFKSP